MLDWPASTKTWTGPSWWGEGEGGAEASSTGIHCSGHVTGCATFASLLVTLGLVVCGITAARKVAAATMRTSARKLEASFLAYPG